MLRVEHTDLDKAAELIRQTKRPIIFAGHGVTESGAMEQVRALAERTSTRRTQEPWRALTANR